MTTVAFLGPSGTFTEAAMLKLVDVAGLADVEPLAVNSPSEAFAAVREGDADFACVAIENSVDGAVTTTHDAFLEGEPVQVYFETSIEIAFAIMCRPGTDLAGARRIATHPVAYNQVRGWLAEHAPHLEFVPASSNAAAAEMVAAGEADVAAAPERAAALFGLDVVAADVADVRGAETRFVLVGKAGKPTARTGNDCTSVIFTLPNDAGTLVGALQEFAHRGVSLSRIESRPTRKVFGTYRFYIDLAGHIDDAPVAEALRALWLRAEEITFVGSWPAPGEGEPAGVDADRLQQAEDWVAKARSGN